jgi:antitoxin Phd
MRTWQLQEAKNKFSQVLNEALIDGPQIVTRHGVEVVVILSYDQYRQLTVPRQRLSEFFRRSPLAETELDLRRDSSSIRNEFNL